MKQSHLCVALVVCGMASGCERRAPPAAVAAHARYTIGPAWESQGYWFYPEEQPSYQATGLAVVERDRGTKAGVTADGEQYDPRQLAGAHQTLQLPAILRVTNLQNGRQISIRVNDRGPASPGRILSVTPRVAELLAMDPVQPTRIRIEEDGQRSRDLLHGVKGAPPPEAFAAPVGSVEEQSLMPGGAAALRKGSPPQAAQTTAASGPPSQALVESVTFGPPEPGQLWIDAGHFSTALYAQRLAAELQGTVQRDGYGRSAVFKVRLGPFDRADAADAALDRARSSGVTGARIIVE